MNSPSPKRGEIWLLNFDRAIGAEIKKKRPAVVISSDSIGILPLKIVTPITGWDDRYKDNVWHIKLKPNEDNGLEKISAVDVLQVKSLAIERFIKPIGVVSSSSLEDIIFALALITECNL